jgi:hypothetical protein
MFEGWGFYFGFWGVEWRAKLKFITFGVLERFLASIKLKRNYFFVSALCDLLLCIMI